MPQYSAFSIVGVCVCVDVWVGVVVGGYVPLPGLIRVAVPGVVHGGLVAVVRAAVGEGSVGAVGGVVGGGDVAGISLSLSLLEEVVRLQVMGVSVGVDMGVWVAVSDVACPRVMAITRAAVVTRAWAVVVGM